MTTSAPKRMRFAALGLSTALSIGVLAPFVATGSADAAVSCSTAKASTAKANAQLAKDQAKLRKAKKKLRKARAARKAAPVIKHDKKVVKKAKKRVRFDKARKAAAVKAQKNCTNPTKSTPQGTANPLSNLFGQLGDALKSAGAPAQLTDALAQAQTQLASLPLDPSAVQNAINAGQAEIQKNIAALSADPTKDSIPDVLNAILNPLKAGLAAAQAPGLPTVISGVQQLLAPLDSYNLSLLTGALPAGGLPGAGSIPGLDSLLGLLGGSGLPIPGV